MKCGYVAIVGRPNVGKSTLLNRILGQKISITSKKAQTTRHRILGIDTEGDTQVIFVDTPGLHVHEARAINRIMNRAASSTLADVDINVFVVEGTHWNDDDEHALKFIAQAKLPTILFVNKVDNVKDKTLLLPHLEQLAQRYPFIEIIPGSAEQGDNVDLLRAKIRSLMPEGQHYFPEDYVTDRSQRFMAAEIVREKLMRNLGNELPYSITVEIEQFKYDDKGIIHIHALILVERQGQKQIVIGNKGEKLKLIGRDARREMERMFDAKVFLKTWVKVKEGWADDERALKSLGYNEFD
jgi:GTP-binding protein Era